MDYKLKPFNSPQYDYNAHNPEETFERTCIRTLNKVWFPSLPFSTLEKKFLDEHPGEVLNYYWYRWNFQLPAATMPDLSFCKLKTAWSLDLYTLLKQDIKKLDVYKRWEEQPSDGFVFPLVGSQVVLYENWCAPDINCVCQAQKDGEQFLVISLLKDYATLFIEKT